jgi:hypothetical protein
MVLYGLLWCYGMTQGLLMQLIQGVRMYVMLVKFEVLSLP